MDVWILGRIGYDLYALDHNRALPEVERFSRHLGGSSANTAVGLARLGLKAGIISAVGDDLLADYLLDFLRREKVDTTFVTRVAGHNTSLCLTEVWPPEHFRQVFYRASPADAFITLPPQALDRIRKGKMFVTNGTNLANEPSRSAALAALQEARSAGVRTVLDADYRASSWKSPGDAGRAAREALPFADVLLANEEELALLTESTSGEAQIAEVLAAGPTVLVQKLGARGVAAHTKSEHSIAASRTKKLVCAVGGGDAFAAGFLYALYRGMDLPQALAFGNAAAAIVVSKVSCADVMPTLSQLTAELRHSQTKKRARAKTKRRRA